MRNLILLTLLLASTSAPILAFDVTLYDKGKPAATLILSENPTVSAKFAAEELNEHLQRLTGGFPLPIKTDKESVAGLKISIGDTEYSRKQGLTPDSVKKQEYVINRERDLITLYGRDATDVEGPIPGPFDEHGSLDATYEFLERFAGVRWYHPGDLGRFIPKQPTFAVAEGKLRQMPDMTYLWMAEMNDFRIPSKDDPVPDDQLKLWRLRMRMGGEKYEANHSFDGYGDRFKKDHPDWFLGPQPCYTNDGFIDQVAQDAIDFFDGKPLHPGAMAMGNYFGIVPGDNSWWCGCEVCKAELALHEHNENDNFFANSTASTYYWNFANKVAKKVAEKYPGKYLAALSYMTWAGYPEGIEVEPNIAVQVCLGAPRCWVDARNRDHELGILEDWGKHSKDRPLFLWLYYNFPAMDAFGGKFDPLPGYSANHLIPWMKVYHDNHVRGMFIEHSSEFRQSHLLDVPDIYLTFRLGRDAKLDGKETLNEFFKNYYGAAAKPMREIYDGMEAAFWDFSQYPQDGQPRTAEEVHWGNLVKPEMMAKWSSLLEEAKTLANTRNDRARVDFFDRGIFQPMVHSFERHPKLVVYKKIPPPEMVIPKVSNAGGDPEKVEWNKANPTEVFRQMSGEPAKVQVKAHLAYDETHLYIWFENDTVGSKLLNLGVWGDDLQLYFDRSREPPYYHRLTIAADGSVNTERTVAAGDGFWHSGIQVKAINEPDLPWNVKVSLPLSEVVGGELNPGDSFYMNLFRMVQGQGEYLGWSPTFANNFDIKAYMGKVTLEPEK